MMICPACGPAAASGPVYSERCACGGLWGWHASEAPPARNWVSPLWSEPGAEHRLWKREDLNPTGSYKDRGAEFLARVADEAGARSLVLDSSGSAALAGARMAAKLGVSLAIEAPEAVSPRRRRTLALLGAQVRAEGTRDEAAERAMREARQRFWFSHVYHPAFAYGVSGLVEEVSAQTPKIPETWYVPVGNGALLLGLKEGLKRLGWSPRLVAVQAEACSGLLRPGVSGSSRAGGLAIPSPPRREEILSALENPGRDVVTVSEEAIAAGEVALAHQGVSADPAAAAVHAALQTRRDSEPVLAILSGAGSR